MHKPRWIKTRRRNTWTRLRKEIQHCCIQLNLPTKDFAPVSLYEWSAIQEKIWDTFSSSKHSGWIWETLSVPYAALYLGNEAIIPLEKLVNPLERIFLLFNESVNGRTKFWIYEGLASACDQVCKEANGLDEVLIVSKQYDWLLSLNHHQILAGTGIMYDKIKATGKAL